MSYAAAYYQGRAAHPMWRHEAHLVAALAGPAGRGAVVDVGCGAGELLAVLQPACGLGVDLNSAAIEMARSRHGEYDFRLGDACALDLPDGSADCVVSMHLIEHLPDAAAALECWRRVVRPGGQIVIITPNADFSHPETYDDPDHKHIYSGPELTRLARRCGLTVRRCLTLGLWGGRDWPALWRLAPWMQARRLPALPGLRWRGQSLCLAAERKAS